MEFYEENIPKEMKNKKQWVCYRKKTVDGKTKKMMLNPADLTFARCNDPSTWATFLTGMKALRNKKLGLDGLAFVLTDGYVFIDTDHSIDEKGNVNEVTKKLLDMLHGTYAEKSCSGHGIHIICKGHMPKNAKKRNDSLGVEMYETKRFLCMTGDVIDGRKEIKDCGEAIAEISKSIVGVSPPRVILPRTTPTMSDNEIMGRIRNSAQSSKFERLYSGDISAYPSASNADYAMVRILAFWTQDRSQIESIMRSSGLVREKWDHRLGNSTYLDVTIDNALSQRTRTYSPGAEL